MQVAKLIGLLWFGAVVGCGGGGQGSTGATSSIPTLTFSAAGLAPPALTVSSAAVMLVTNADPVASHQLEGDAGGPCAGIVSGLLAPSASWDAHLPAGPKDCTFHDTQAPSDTRFQAAVSVSAPGVYVPPGGIY
jgi:hypothetical protein